MEIRLDDLRGPEISQLLREHLNSMALLSPPESVHALDLDRPTADFTVEAAMTEVEVVAALGVGWDAVNPTADLLVVGEMGIGNTTSAAAITLMKSSKQSRVRL